MAAHTLGLSPAGDHEVGRLSSGGGGNLQAPPIPWDSNSPTQESKPSELLQMPVLDSIPPLGSWPYGKVNTNSELDSKPDPKPLATDKKPAVDVKLPPGGLKPKVMITPSEKEHPTWEKSPERNQPKPNQNPTKPAVNESVMAGLWDKFLRQQVPTGFVRSSTPAPKNLTTNGGHPMLRRSLGIGYPTYLLSRFPPPRPQGYRTSYFAGRLFDLSWRKRRR